jgi:hypothetical protein
MDHAILYLVLRYLAMGVALLLPASWAHWPPQGLFVFYVTTFLVAFRNYLGEATCEYGAGMFDKGFPPSGRRRCVLRECRAVCVCVSMGRVCVCVI